MRGANQEPHPEEKAMARRKRTSKPTPELNSRNFQIAYVYAQADDTISTVHDLAQYLRGIQGFKELVDEILDTKAHTDRRRRHHLGHGESLSGEWSIMFSVAMAFYAGIAYGERFGDNLSGSLPRIDRQFMKEREFSHPRCGDARTADLLEVVRWRVDVFGIENAIPKDCPYMVDALKRYKVEQKLLKQVGAKTGPQLVKGA
jgi:hypothetical protein